MNIRSIWCRMRRLVRTPLYGLAFLIAVATGIVVVTRTPGAQEDRRELQELRTITEQLGTIVKELRDIVGAFRPPRPPLKAGPVNGSLYYETAVGETFKPPILIFLPDIEVFLHNTASGVDSPAVTTDLFGRYRFPNQAPGTYELHWKAQRGWAAGQHPDSIVIGSGPRFPVPARIQPQVHDGVIFGRVTLGDGGTPWSYDELFKVNHTATVTILNAARTATLAGPLHTNSEGRYAAAGLPRSQPTTIRVQSQAAIVTRAVDADACFDRQPRHSDRRAIGQQATGDRFGDPEDGRRARPDCGARRHHRARRALPATSTATRYSTNGPLWRETAP